MYLQGSALAYNRLFNLTLVPFRAESFTYGTSERDEGRKEDSRPLLFTNVCIAQS